VKVANSIIELIGETPIVKVHSLTGPNDAEIFLKLESFNPGGSVKDRIGMSMVEDAEKSGKLKPGGTIIEATSGNTGIGLALMAAAKGYKAILVMPDSASVERRNLLKAYGAEVLLTPGAEGMNGAIRKAREMFADHPEYFMAQQFDNPANTKVHRETTGEEIMRQLDGKLDAFVVGVGTGGTLGGAGQVLKDRIPGVKLVAVEPATSAVLSGGKPGPHKLQGLGAGFIPSILDTSIIDEVIAVENEIAFETSRNLAKNEGILVGISTGANVWAAVQVAKRLGVGKRILTIAPSTGERYLSTALFQFE